MFPNLNAEQARINKSNSDMAELLGISRVSYEARKRDGRFSISDAKKLCDYYSCDYSYLFSEIPLVPRSWVPSASESGAKSA